MTKLKRNVSKRKNHCRVASKPASSKRHAEVVDPDKEPKEEGMEERTDRTTEEEGRL